VRAHTHPCAVHIGSMVVLPVLFIGKKVGWKVQSLIYLYISVGIIVMPVLVQLLRFKK